MMAKRARRDADDLRRKAGKIDFLANKIDAHRAAGTAPDEWLLCRMLDVPCAGGYVKKLYGFHWLATYDEVVCWLHDLPRRSDAAALVTSQQPAAVPDVPVAIDAVEQATQILRSARGEEVDWSREPLTERERRLRAKWIEEHLADPMLTIALDCHARDIRLRRKPVASDLAAAAEEAQRIFEREREERDRDDWQRLSAELDDQRP